MKAKTEDPSDIGDHRQIRLAKTLTTTPVKTGLQFLSERDFPAWDKLVEASPQGTLFSLSSWLKAIEGNVQVLGYFDNNRLTAGMPLYFSNYLGLKSCVMPNLTPVWGVIMEPLRGTVTSCASREMGILKQFATYLAGVSFFEHRFHPTLSNWLPFYWSGFTQTSLSTYAVTRLRDLDGVWTELPASTKASIRDAEQHGVRVRAIGIDALQTKAGCLIRGLPSGSSRSLERLYKAAQERNAGECIAAVDENGTLQSAAFVAWDSKTTYYLNGATLAGSLAAEAEMFLIWTLIRDAAARSASFEFCGFDSENTYQLAQAFNGEPVLYSKITRQPLIVRAWFSLLNTAPSYT